MYMIIVRIYIHIHYIVTTVFQYVVLFKILQTFTLTPQYSLHYFTFYITLEFTFYKCFVCLANSSHLREPGINVAQEVMLKPTLNIVYMK